MYSPSCGHVKTDKSILIRYIKLIFNVHTKYCQYLEVKKDVHN